MGGMAWIELDGAVNMRDLGGLPTRGDGQTVSGRLLRSDNLQELSAADVALLVDDIGLTTVVDLRSTAELKAEGPAPLQATGSVRHVHLPVLPEGGSATDMVADALLTRGGTERSRYPGDTMTGHYLGYMEDRPDQVVAAVRTIATAEGPVLVHCAAGKDRTGVVVALALSAVGVRPEAIVADYMATGERTGPLLDRLRRSPTYADDINSKPQAEHEPRPGTMAAFLDEVDTRYGGAGRWLADHGFGEDGLDLLRAKLLSV
jgi:protein-tyrosine phosphatase